MPKIVVGVCAMDKKAKSKQMTAILERLEHFNEFEVILFGDDTILNKPVEDWPVVQALLAWHSERFPLKKAQAYVALRKPYCVNDIFQQDILLDRRRVYEILRLHGIPCPHHIIISRDDLPEGQADPDGFTETEDYVEMDGVRIEKPFVEKPASGEDHNIYIYYPHSMGGGVKKLFRKVDNKSGDYDPDHPGTVRRGGSFIYEEFLATGGTDVKVYTVGPRYAHAEARKSPVVDGKVLRTADGKEVRFPVLLSPQEKEISRMVCLAFGQRVCGFDLLRSERGKSYVCDVNGWSFVKNSHKYYDDTAGILRMVILSAVAPHRLLAPAPQHLPLNVSPLMPGALRVGATPGSDPSMKYVVSYDDMSSSRNPNELGEDVHAGEELRCVLAVIRHGDRTPKQKMKMQVTQEPLLDLFHKYMDGKGKQAKLKSPNELQELLDITRDLLEQLDAKQRDASLSSGGGDDSSTHEEDELREKFRIMKTVLEQGGHFTGINRKVQLKPLKWGAPPEGQGSDAGSEKEARPRCVEALLILKHGGVLTHSGRQQAESLGMLFREIMYPQHGPAGGGLLRLHSTYRHDFKIYSSDEGRVQSSAAAFTKGLLDLEGAALTPILVSLVKKDVGMLDAFGKGASEDIRRAKAELYYQMTLDTTTGASLQAEQSWRKQKITPPQSPTRAQSGDLGSFSPVEDKALGDNGGHNAGLSPQPLSRPNSSLGGGGLPPGRATSMGSLSSIDLKYNKSGEEADMESSYMPGASNIPGRVHIYPMPADPLECLHSLRSLLQALVDSLRQKCMDELRTSEPPKAYSALTTDPRDFVPETGKPCSGEKLLLMFDRWRKLLKALFTNKSKDSNSNSGGGPSSGATNKDAHQGGFDISKIPDIYDAAKYDMIHNISVFESEEDILRKVYDVAKVLANAVIPNEYGITCKGKLYIGSMICSNLLGKLLADLASMREESVATSGLLHADDSSRLDLELDELTYQDTMVPVGGGGGAAAAGGGGLRRSQVPPTVPEAAALEDIVGTEPEDDGDDTVLHRLCPTYAQDINSPLRHVRTRIYFTSESHMHSLINVLRYCHIGVEGEEGLLSEEGQDLLKTVPELDYMTHIVFRMFENKRLHLDDPSRFRVEMLFSPGAGYDPSAADNHVLPVAPRFTLNKEQETGVPLAKLEAMTKPFAKPFKRNAEYPYTLRGTTLPSNASELDFWM